MSKQESKRGIDFEALMTGLVKVKPETKTLKVNQSEKDFLKSIGKRIKDFRTSKGLTIPALTRLSGVEIKDAEKGKDLTLVALYRIAVSLEIEPKELIQ